jgi:LPS export ABC transporter protein LptC
MNFKFKKSKIVTIAIAVIAAAVVGFIIFFGSLKEDKRMKIFSDSVDIQVKDVLYTDVSDSGLKWEIRADTVKYMKKDNLALFDNVKVKIITKDGKTLVIAGKNGRLNTENKNMDIAGNVTIVSDKGDRLTTDVLKYSGPEQRVYTHSPVVMENGRMRVGGTGMSLSLKKEDLSLLSKVKARIK